MSVLNDCDHPGLYLLLVGLLVVINVGYFCYYLVKKRAPVVPETAQALLHWWKMHQIFFWLFRFGNMLGATFVIPNLLVSLLEITSSDTLLYLRLGVLFLFMVATFFFEAPYQAILRKIVAARLQQDNPSLQSLSERGQFVSLLFKKKKQIGLHFEIGEDIGYLLFEKQKLSYHGLLYQTEIEREWIRNVALIPLSGDTLNFFGVKASQVTYEIPGQDEPEVCKILVRGGITSFSYRRPNQVFWQALNHWLQGDKE